MPNYRTIKELVIDAYVTHGDMPPYEELTEQVKACFPTSRWQKTHYTWYKAQIRNGHIKIPEIEETQDGISESVIEDSITQSIDTQVSLERDLQQYLAGRVHEIENGLALVEGGVEYVVEAGRIDLLAKDSGGTTVVIELKAGKAKDAALGQLLGYIGCLSKNNKSIRGVLVASDFDSRVVFAVRALPNIKLVKYELSFKLSEIA